MDSYTLRYDHKKDVWIVIQWHLYTTKFGSYYDIKNKHAFASNEQAVKYMNNQLKGGLKK